MYNKELTRPSTGVCNCRYGINARVLCLRVWPAHRESHKTESADDPEGTWGIVPAAIFQPRFLKHGGSFSGPFRLLTSVLPAFLRQPSFLQAHHEHDQNLYSHAVSAHLHPALVPHYMLHAFGYHYLLYDSCLLCFRISVHTSGTSMGQDDSWIMH